VTNRRFLRQTSNEGNLTIQPNVEKNPLRKDVPDFPICLQSGETATPWRFLADKAEKLESLQRKSIV